MVQDVLLIAPQYVYVNISAGIRAQMPNSYHFSLLYNKHFKCELSDETVALVIDFSIQTCASVMVSLGNMFL